MGRLTLNVLLSFAQFEREVTAERIQDKIAASKRKGMRVGGPVPLGYDVENKRLVVNEEEAERVRFIFRRYLEVGCLTVLLQDLRERGIVTKVSRKSRGAGRGGIPFSRGPLRYLLRNRVYIGEVVHKDQHYPGEHLPILDRGLFEAVQQKLASRSVGRRRGSINTDSLLTGYVYDDRGNRMSPTTSNKGGLRYRYYTSQALVQGRKQDAGSVPRVPATEVEAAVLGALEPLKSATPSSAPEITGSDGSERELIEHHVARITIQKGAVEIALVMEKNQRRSSFPGRRSDARAGASSFCQPTQEGKRQHAIHYASRARLVEQIAKGRMWLDGLVSGHVTDTKQIAEREGCSERSIRMTLTLAFLAPDLVKGAVDGTLPYGMGVSRLMDLPPEWRKQREMVVLPPFDVRRFNAGD